MSEAVADPPRPEASELTARFWEAAREHVLVRPVCSACGKNFFTPQIACPACLSVEWTYEPSSGRGAVYSATVVHRAPFSGLTTPYQVAIVDLNEGWSMLTNLVDSTDLVTPIGTEVEVVWIDVDAELTLPAFRSVKR